MEAIAEPNVCIRPRLSGSPGILWLFVCR